MHIVLYLTSYFAAMCVGLGITLNCSEPTTKALLDAFSTNVSMLTGMRPVNNLHTPTNVSIHFSLYGILDVVSHLAIIASVSNHYFDPDDP